jgi:exopolysaccharide biosynthesis polyprenyl glycosylphosphotransferase
MNERHRLTTGLLKLFDLAIVLLAFLLTTFSIVKVEHGLSLMRFLSMRIRVANIVILVFALVICHAVFQICGLYRSRRLSKRLSELLDVLKAMSLNTACFIAIASFFSIQMITIQFLGIFWLIGTVLICLARLSMRRVAGYVRVHGRDLRYMLVIGTNSRAVKFASSLLANPERGYRLLGFVDDDWPGMTGLERAGFKVVSDNAGLAEYLRRNVVDEVAIYLPFASFYKHCSEAAKLCEEHGITMRFNSDVFGLKTTRWRAEEFEGDQYIATYKGSSELGPRTAKRLLDIIGASAALLVFSPILIVAAMAIKLTSAGPVFFLQERIGLNKRRFKIFKFRTMVPNAERLMTALEKYNEVSGPVFKIKNDPRITAIGRFLRRSSIDELPQLLNVLNGDMSLVGPRPLPVRDYEGFNEDWQRRRFSVKPGITCLWQVNGRSGISFSQWMLLDLQYMDEWSFWLDLKILAKTVPAVFRGAGAA